MIETKRQIPKSSTVPNLSQGSYLQPVD